MAQKKIIHWFRNDLRLKDNPAFTNACAQGSVLPIFILDDQAAKRFKLGGASRWWLHNALESLDKDLKGALKFYVGDSEKIIVNLVKKNHIDRVVWNRCYEPYAVNQAEKIKEKLERADIEVKSFNASLLCEPWEATKKDGSPFRVFTPFFKNCLKNYPAFRDPIEKARKIIFLKDKSSASLSLKSLNLLPKNEWHEKFHKAWKVSEAEGHKRLKNFLQKGLSNYKEGRDFPSLNSVSRLSPFLRFGQISPHQIYFSLLQTRKNSNRDHFIRELFWREFSYSLLYFYPTLPQKNLQEKFNKFPWSKSKKNLRAWQNGQTGYPIVDAGMRELWQTGYMHNRVRMIVGSFLVKNLLIHWHEGERWFWDCLLDADLANNSASWQWVAGCGADAAPFFRIFNPITQGEKFDKDGEYTKKFVPELKKMPNKYLFKPFDAPDHVLKDADLVLGENYPKPIVDLKWSRERALDAFTSLKKVS